MADIKSHQHPGYVSDQLTQKSSEFVDLFLSVAQRIRKYCLSASAHDQDQQYSKCNNNQHGCNEKYAQYSSDPEKLTKNHHSFSSANYPLIETYRSVSGVWGTTSHSHAVKVTGPCHIVISEQGQWGDCHTRSLCATVSAQGI